MSKLTKEELDNYIDIRNSIDKKLKKIAVDYDRSIGQYELEEAFDEDIFMLDLTKDYIDIAFDTCGGGIESFRIPMGFILDKKKYLKKIKDEALLAAKELEKIKRTEIENNYILEQINKLDQQSKNSIKIFLEMDQIERDHINVLLNCNS